jgi:hypothetical protein
VRVVRRPRLHCGQSVGKGHRYAGQSATREHEPWRAAAAGSVEIKTARRSVHLFSFSRGTSTRRSRITCLVWQSAVRRWEGIPGPWIGCGCVRGQRAALPAWWPRRIATAAVPAQWRAGRDLRITRAPRKPSQCSTSTDSTPHSSQGIVEPGRTRFVSHGLSHAATAQGIAGLDAGEDRAPAPLPERRHLPCPALSHSRLQPVAPSRSRCLAF